MSILNEETITQHDVTIENLLHESSNILKTSYNHNTEQLYITFKNGGVYYYNAVTLNVYREMKLAESVGKFINSVVKKDNTAVKVGAISGELLDDLKQEIESYKEKGD